MIQLAYGGVTIGKFSVYYSNFTISFYSRTSKTSMLICGSELLHNKYSFYKYDLFFTRGIRSEALIFFVPYRIVSYATKEILEGKQEDRNNKGQRRKPVCLLWCRFSWSDLENLRPQSVKSH